MTPVTYSVRVRLPSSGAMCFWIVKFAPVLPWGGIYGNYEVALLVKGESTWRLAQVVDALTAAPV